MKSGLGLVLGEPVDHWEGCSFPPFTVMTGKWVVLMPVKNTDFASQLFDAYQLDGDGKVWDYLPYGPFDSVAKYRSWMIENCLGTDPQFYAIIDRKTNKALGIASYLRISPENGSIEVGHLAYSPMLQRTRLSTEVMYLMMNRVFELGYRRYEWKCNSLNIKSRQAAERIGMTFEGVFRQMMVVKGRNRDTAWYSIIDKEWPKIRQGFLDWMEDENFNNDNIQKSRLINCINSYRR
ncbi:MAG: GNAT family N-acetyltransferase [Actinobacteria bacterium]|nr:GNAT family N-acetyltransferase [Actinomycetota bacterium]